MEDIKNTDDLLLFKYPERKLSESDKSMINVISIVHKQDEYELVLNLIIRHVRKINSKKVESEGTCFITHTWDYFYSAFKKFYFSEIESEKDRFYKTEYHLSHKYYQLFPELKFGKYKGKNIIEIIILDPDYLLWCVINIKSFTLMPQLFLDNNIFSLQKFKLAFLNNMAKLESAQIDSQYFNSNEYQDNLEAYQKALLDEDAVRAEIRSEFQDWGRDAYWNLD